jgi:hypothetical protein
MFRIAAFLTACACCAQPSDNPRDIAWAAYNAARQNRPDTIPQLAALLDAYSGTPIDDRGPVRPADAAIEAVADALIQLEAKLPAETVMHLDPNFPAQTIILLSRASDNTEPLLGIYKSTKWGDLWLAAGNLLTLHPTSEFVRSLLNGVVVSFSFRVVPQDEARGSGGSWGCSGDSLMDPDKAFADWPRARMYRLNTSGHASNIFAPGIHPVGFSTWETTDYRDPWTDGDCSGDKSKYWRTGLIAQLQGKKIDEFHLEPSVELTMTYWSAAAFEERVKAAIEYQSSAFQSAIDYFVGSGILSIQDSSALHLKCRIAVNDERPSPRIELPSVEGRWCATPVPTDSKAFDALNP